MQRLKISEYRLYGLTGWQRKVSLTLKDFATGLEALGIRCDMLEYRAMFDAADLSGDRRIDLSEIRVLLFGRLCQRHFRWIAALR